MQRVRLGDFGLHGLKSSTVQRRWLRKRGNKAGPKVLGDAVAHRNGVACSKIGRLECFCYSTDSCSQNSEIAPRYLWNLWDLAGQAACLSPVTLQVLEKIGCSPFGEILLRNLALGEGVTSRKPAQDRHGAPSTDGAATKLSC